MEIGRRHLRVAALFSLILAKILAILKIKFMPLLQLFAPFYPCILANSRHGSCFMARIALGNMGVVQIARRANAAHFPLGYEIG